MDVIPLATRAIGRVWSACAAGVKGARPSHALPDYVAVFALAAAVLAPDSAAQNIVIQQRLGSYIGSSTAYTDLSTWQLAVPGTAPYRVVYTANSGRFSPVGALTLDVSAAIRGTVPTGGALTTARISDNLTILVSAPTRFELTATASLAPLHGESVLAYAGLYRSGFARTYPWVCRTGSTELQFPTAPGGTGLQTQTVAGTLPAGSWTFVAESMVQVGSFPPGASVDGTSGVTATLTLIDGAPFIIGSLQQGTGCVAGPGQIVLPVSGAPLAGVRWQRVLATGGTPAEVVDGSTPAGSFVSGSSTPTLSFSGLATGESNWIYTPLILLESGCDWQAAGQGRIYVSQPPSSPPTVTQVACSSGVPTVSVTVPPGTAGIPIVEWQVATGAGTWSTLSSQPLTLPCGGSAAATSPTSSSTRISGQACPAESQLPVRCVLTTGCGVYPSDPVLVSMCRANFNCIGGTSVQDILDFLIAWFSNNPAADFNTAGGITVQDIFDFLAAWFQGC